MRFQLDIALTEEDYLAYNLFHSFQSASGRKLITRSRILFVSIMALLVVFLIFTLGLTAFTVTYAVLLGLFTAVYLLIYKKILVWNVKAQIKRLKKIGKLPFDPTCKLEFHDDKLVEITPTKRIEQSYADLERICVSGDRFVYLYNSSVGAHILPIPQLAEQLNLEEFWSFLFQKCNTVEYY